MGLAAAAAWKASLVYRASHRLSWERPPHRSQQTTRSLSEVQMEQHSRVQKAALGWHNRKGLGYQKLGAWHAH